MPVQIRKHIDKLRRRFLWYGGSSVRKKISLVSWSVVCASKSQGGLGLLNLHTINVALLAKWWYRYNDPAAVGMWKYIILAKYGSQGYSYRMSAFWRNVLKLKPFVDLGFQKKSRKW